jgi:integrase
LPRERRPLNSGAASMAVIDPLAGAEAARAAPTVNMLVERYKAEILPTRRPNTRREYLALLNNEIMPAIGAMKVGAVSHTDIARLHQKMSARAPYRANRLVALLSRLFSLAIKWGWISRNPCHGIERNPEEPRERYLTGLELARLIDVLNGFEDQQAANIVRLMLLTGARKGEVLEAEWRQFDLNEGVWVKPSSHTKQKRLHRAPLNAEAIALLRSIRQRRTYVFPARLTGLPRQDIRKPWARICQAAGLLDMRRHDLRHSFASILAGKNLSLPIIGKLMGHTQTNTTQRYAHLADNPLREATALVGKIVAPNLTKN